MKIDKNNSKLNILLLSVGVLVILILAYRLADKYIFTKINEKKIPDLSMQYKEDPDILSIKVKDYARVIEGVLRSCLANESNGQKAVSSDVQINVETQKKVLDDALSAAGIVVIEDIKQILYKRFSRMPEIIRLRKQLFVVIGEDGVLKSAGKLSETETVVVSEENKDRTLLKSLYVREALKDNKMSLESIDRLNRDLADIFNVK